jgi:hypothetical protein
MGAVLNPAAARCWMAVAWSKPATDGTWTEVGPVLTLRTRGSSLLILVPPVGLEEITSSAGTLVLWVRVVVTLVKPSPDSSL